MTGTLALGHTERDMPVYPILLCLAHINCQMAKPSKPHPDPSRTDLKCTTALHPLFRRLESVTSLPGRPRRLQLIKLACHSSFIKPLSSMYRSNRQRCAAT